MKSTKDYADEVINFMRNHPAMYNAVYPVHKRPLVVRTNVDYEFTTITVDQVTAADGNYEVLFLGTGECYVNFQRKRNEERSKGGVSLSLELHHRVIRDILKWLICIRSQSELVNPLIRVRMVNDSVSRMLNNEEKKSPLDINHM